MSDLIIKNGLVYDPLNKLDGEKKDIFIKDGVIVEKVNGDAKVINAAGEYEAAEKLSLAAEIFEKYPVTIQLRYLQTLMEIAAENNSTTIFPVPIDLFKPFIKAMEAKVNEKE